MLNKNEVLFSAFQSWQASNNTQKLRDKDSSLWTGEDESAWMGWLSLPLLNENDIHDVELLRKEIQQSGFTHIVLLGMGGSSLFPEMMAKIYDTHKLIILDSTDPVQITDLENKIDLEKTFFMVSSKSGSTLESHLLLDYFFDKLKSIHQKKSVGDFFAAITDPGSRLEKFAKENHFKAIFNGLPSIGGRYSALSVFGMVPLGLMGADIKSFLNIAEKMSRACLDIEISADNPGVSLGIKLGLYGNAGKNKITFVISDAIAPLGGWLEQLIAESSGKNGKALIPIVNEPLSTPEHYSDDRVFVCIEHGGLSKDIHEKCDLLEKAGHPVIKCAVHHIENLGAECYRWEIATAVACSILGVNPFNQPDVEATKIKTHEMIKSVKTDAILEKSESQSIPSITQLKQFFEQLHPGDYFAICAFIEMSAEIENVLQQIRLWVRDKKQVATVLGFGPRFLHSTGQAHKGGSNNGVFLQFVREYSPSQDVILPDKNLSFGKVIQSQACADLAVLSEKSRRVLQVNLGEDPIPTLKHLLTVLQTLQK